MPAAMTDEKPMKPFDEHSPLKNGGLAAAQGAGAGLLISAAQNAFAKQSPGAWGVFTRTGTTVTAFALIGGTYAATQAAVANSNGKDDIYSEMAGGCAAGFLAGVRGKSIPMALGSCVLLGGAMGAFDAIGGMRGNMDRSLSPEERRKRFFKPGKEPPQSAAAAGSY